ncbi:MAG: ABC transporter substrate-binding protein [Synechococcus sp.]
MFLTTLLLALSFSQTACQPQRHSDRLTVASAGRIASLDPAQASTYGTLQLLSALGDTLYSRERDGSLKPQLAASQPQISDGGRTITIPLRRDVLFHDGTRFDAAAMAFSLRRFLRIGTQSYVVGDRIQAIETPAVDVLRLRLTRPSSSLESLLTSPYLTPISPTAYANHQERFLNDRFIGTGPYRLVSFQATQQRLVPFEGYWGEAPGNAGLDLINLSNSTALFGALRSGEVDVLLSDSIDEEQRLALDRRAAQGLLLQSTGPAMQIGYVTFLSNAPPLQSQQVRRALVHSLDRALISERVSHHQRQPLRSLIPPSLRSEQPEPWPRYNPNQARRLLRQAGYCNGQALELPFTYRSNVPSDRLMALTWQAQLRRDLDDCLRLNLEGVESTTVYRQLGEGAFKAVMLDWGGSYPDPEAYLTPLLSCSQSRGNVCEVGEAVISGSFWTQPGLEEALRRSDESQGVTRLQQLLRIDARAAEGAAYLPVWLVTPKAWAQTHLAPPEFNGSGQLLLARLRERR